ncbi:DUF2207 domain-containing protein [Paracoccus methylarcula]|uniref:DUF2207 domain-containing protein n=1 Tax=Paracoccus methylarcula TaxID=72022 RepID=A0A3R7LRG2_9RHOB|nr:DUF2207 domain-containing protein [Paracoccus methylarcula]RNF36261.1 DUF2207 domain-containing protein [Paracoccus methylarcula]
MKTVTRILTAFLFVLGLAGSALADEEIRNFHALIDVGADATLKVTETITVNVEGEQISRGIFRDIPLRYEDANGRIREVRLDVRSVRRDGKDEPYRTERNSGVLRIRIGDADVLLPHGVHSYEITYDTTRQIRYFDNHDELYWNVTGNGWDFPILEASAEIRLPPGGHATDVTYFTGPYGSTEQAARAERLDNGNRVLVEATRGLGRREGLTAVVAFPKEVVAPVSEEELNADWRHDNLGWIIGAGGLAIIFAFYLLAWSRVGRDPPKDIVVPRWTAPDGVSPALANYIEKRGFRGSGWEAFSASVIDLAVKGHLELDRPKRTMTIRRKGDGIPEGIGIGQRAILNALPADGDTLTVNKSNGSKVQSVGRAFRQAVESEHRNQFYRSNPLFLAFGGFLSVIVLLLVIAMGGFAPQVIATVFAAMFPSIVIAIFAVSIGRQFRGAHSLGSRIRAVIVTAVIGFMGLNMAGGFFKMLTQIEFDLRVLAVVAGLVITNIVFFCIMGAPTQIGQKRSAEIAGLKQYLTFAEKDRMNMQGTPEMSPQHFETLLPYAVALGVEKPWSRTFDAWLATALAAGTAAYAGPHWYHGRDFSSSNVGAGLGTMAGSLSNSFTASLPTPKSSSSGFSSSGGGGGFSGGGGGGGGGGGW